MKFPFFFIAAIFSIFFTGCNPSPDKIREALKKDPTILTDAIKENPVEILTAMRDASMKAQEQMRKDEEINERKERDDAISNPKMPTFSPSDIIRGSSNGPIVIVKYSDFQCGYCQRGYKTIQELMKRYEGKIQFHYRHLPLPNHPQALPAALYFEALGKQSPKLAWGFHDQLFEDMSKVSQGANFFKEIARKLGANMKDLAQDVASAEIRGRVDAQSREANEFGFSGTPGFLVNGIPLKGAYPIEEFESLIKLLQEKGKIAL